MFTTIFTIPSINTISLAYSHVYIINTAYTAPGVEQTSPSLFPRTFQFNNLGVTDPLLMVTGAAVLTNVLTGQQGDPYQGTHVHHVFQQCNDFTSTGIHFVVNSICSVLNRPPVNQNIGPSIVKIGCRYCANRNIFKQSAGFYIGTSCCAYILGVPKKLVLSIALIYRAFPMILEIMQAIEENTIEVGPGQLTVSTSSQANRSVIPQATSVQSPIKKVVCGKIEGRQSNSQGTVTTNPNISDDSVSDASVHSLTSSPETCSQDMTENTGNYGGGLAQDIFSGCSSVVRTLTNWLGSMFSGQ